MDFLEPLKPLAPADDQVITFPLSSVIVIIVLLNDDIISLTKMRKDPSEKDKFYLTFIEVYNASDAQVSKKERTLDRYLGLIMKYYGYTEKEILEQRDSNILQPRYYVTVKFY